MFSWYKYLIVNLVFSHLGFWSGNLFLIAPFPDLCLLVPFQIILVEEGNRDQTYFKISTSGVSLSADCPALTDPPNGQVDVPVDRQVGDVANYTCLGGFSLVVDSTRECLPNNTWSGSEPTCLILRKYLVCKWNTYGYFSYTDDSLNCHCKGFIQE